MERIETDLRVLTSEASKLANDIALFPHDDPRIVRQIDRWCAQAMRIAEGLRANLSSDGTSAMHDSLDLRGKALAMAVQVVPGGASADPVVQRAQAFLTFLSGVPAPPQPDAAGAAEIVGAMRSISPELRGQIGGDLVAGELCWHALNSAIAHAILGGGRREAMEANLALGKMMSHVRTLMEQSAPAGRFDD